MNLESDSVEIMGRPPKLPSGLRGHRTASGEWFFRIQFDHAGERYYLRLGKVSREIAERKLAELREFAINRAAGLRAPEPSATMLTFRELSTLYLETYRQDMQVQGASLNGYHAARKSVQRAAEVCDWMDRPAALIRASDALALRNNMLSAKKKKNEKIEQRWSGRTVRGTLADLRTIFNWGMRASIAVVRVNPIDGDIISSIPVEDAAPWELLPKEDRRLLQAMRTEQWLIAATLLALDAGLRQDSILSMRIEDLQLDERLLFVTALKGKRRKIKAPEWKPIGTERLLTALQAQSETARAAGSPWLFPSLRDASDQHLSADHLLRRFQKACVAADFGHQRFHSLRHVFNTRAAVCLSEEVRRAVSSHESVQASRHYTHLNTRTGALSILAQVRKLDSVLNDSGWKNEEFLAEFSADSRMGTHRTKGVKTQLQ